MMHSLAKPSSDNLMSFLTALLIPIPKKVKSIKSVSHIQPISLLNTDYKILSKVLNNRLNLITPNIIHHSQTGYVNGCFLHSNTLSLMLSISSGHRFRESL